MDHFAGLDVSVKETSVCIVDDTGKIVREVKVASEPEALLAVLKNPAYRFTRIGLEAGPPGAGTISISGSGGNSSGASNYGISLAASISSTGSGGIALNGTGGGSAGETQMRPSSEQGVSAALTNSTVEPSATDSNETLLSEDNYLERTLEVLLAEEFLGLR